MSKLFRRGKVLVTYVSVLAILAVSVLSVLSGVSFNAFADDAAEDEEVVVTYPLNGAYDANYTKVETAGIWYETIDWSKKTVVDDFTGITDDVMKFCVDENTEGNGTAKTPYIIKTAEQFAAVVTGNLKDAKGNWLSTEGLYFKIADEVKGFNLNNTGSSFDFSKDGIAASTVETELKDATIIEGLEWKLNTGNKVFKGRFDGNGACVYGLKVEQTYAGIFPKIGGNITVKNLTVKNCYFKGDEVSAFFANNSNPGAPAGVNSKHIMFNCQAYGNVLVCRYATNEAIQKCGVFIGQTGGHTGADGAYKSTESNLVVNDCLVYGNIAKHAQNDDDDATNRNITYGLVGNLHRDGSLTINNSIILDSAPHALYYGSNAHLTSKYNTLYTNTFKKWENLDVGVSYGEPFTRKYVYDYYIDKGQVHVQFDHYDADGKNLTNGGNGYDKLIEGSVVYDKNADDIKGATALEGISDEKWTYNAGDFPTPKLYKIREYAAGSAWSGEQAVQFGEGDGSLTAPFTISTAEELALMLTEPVTGAYYKLIADININDTTVENWTANAKKWFTSNDVPAFEASLDGNGHTVSGIYYDGTQTGDYCGLIPVVGNTAEIREITVANSVINANKGSAGAIAGFVADRCGKAVKFNADIVEDTVVFNGSAAFGGIIGNIGYSAVHMNDCFSKTHGLFNAVTGVAKVSRSISIGAYPFANATNVVAKGIYTDTAGAEMEGVYVLDADKMTGTAASKNMTELNFPTSWKIVAGTYPAPTGEAASAEGAKGEVWSGAIATGYAGGTGTKEEPILIETPEQLAKLCSTSYRVKPGKEEVKVGETRTDDKGEPLKTTYADWTTEEKTEWNLSKVKYYKLTADIYVNDVNGKLWADKIGCLDWFSQWVNGSYVTNSHINLDGDGHVIYGLYYYHPQGSKPYVRVGLFPVLSEYSTIENVGLSNVHFEGVSVNDKHPDYVSDTMGAFVGCSEDYDSSYGLQSHDADYNKPIIESPEFEALALKIKNCFVDHNSYISAYFTGGFIGSPYGAPILENCLFTGSLAGHEDQYYTGALTGCDSTYGTQLKGCVVFPTTSKLPIAGGSHGATWRSNPIYWTVYASPCYYFNLKQQYGGDYTKIKRPEERFGEAAKKAMPLLKWEGESDPETNIPYDSAETWSVVDECVPLPTIFKKHRTEEEFMALSTSKFNTPLVTVSFVTGDDEIVVPDIKGDMYSKNGFELPVLERPGYEFTGWYVFSDCSIEYPKDYFPPRDIVLYAGWNQKGIEQDFEQYPDTIWDYDDEYWKLNKPGIKNYQNKYVRGGGKSMHLLGEKPETSDCLLNYEDMLVPGTSYTISFWATTDKADNKPALLSLVHNDYPDYLGTGVALENMAVATGLKVGEWKQFSYSFTARTQWVSLRATGNSSIYFDDVVMASLDGVISDGNVISLGAGGTLSPTTADGVSISVLISALMACAAIAVVSRKNLAEVIEG